MKPTKYSDDPRIAKLGALLQAVADNIVAVGKLVVELRRDIPNCDEVLLQAYAKLTRPLLDRFYRIGIGSLHPVLAYDFNGVAYRMERLNIKLQTAAIENGVEVVVGGTATAPQIKRIPYTKIGPTLVSQVFTDKEIRSVKDQVKYRTEQALKISAKLKKRKKRYEATEDGITFFQKAIVSWNDLVDILTRRGYSVEKPA